MSAAPRAAHKGKEAAGATAEGATGKGEQMQRVWGREYLPAPAPKEQMQGVRGGEYLPAPSRQDVRVRVRVNSAVPPGPKVDHLDIAHSFY